MILCIVPWTTKNDQNVVSIYCFHKPHLPYSSRVSPFGSMISTPDIKSAAHFENIQLPVCRGFIIKFIPKQLHSMEITWIMLFQLVMQCTCSSIHQPCNNTGSPIHCAPLHCHLFLLPFSNADSLLLLQHSFNPIHQCFIQIHHLNLKQTLALKRF